MPGLPCVGGIPDIHRYQLRVEPFDDYREMKAFCKTMEEVDYIRSAYPDLAFIADLN